MKIKIKPDDSVGFFVLEGNIKLSPTEILPSGLLFFFGSFFFCKKRKEYIPRKKIIRLFEGAKSRIGFGGEGTAEICFMKSTNLVAKTSGAHKTDKERVGYVPTAE